MNTQQALELCTVKGNTIHPPQVQLDRESYMALKSALVKSGGMWKGGKIAGFVFSHDPTDILERLRGGDKIDLKKENQFFPTPAHVADLMTSILELEQGVSIMEPSAGSGSLMDAVLRLMPDSTIFFIEKNPLMNPVLTDKFDKMERVFRLNPENDDFISLESEPVFDRIIANPPFTKNQDIDHIYKMFSCLKPGGVMVTLASNHWRTSGNGKEAAFRAWLEAYNAQIKDIDAGEFKESGTQIALCMLKIRKAPLRLIQ